MKGRYQISNPDKTYFLTSTVVDWRFVFITNTHREIIIDSLKHCQKEKGLKIYAWCLMSNHLHLIANAGPEFRLASVIRDFKKFTSKKIVKFLQTNTRKDNLVALKTFKDAAETNPKILGHQFWKQGNHAKELLNHRMTWQKINYIHNNPVRAGMVKFPADYLYSSARNYEGRNGLLDVICITPF